MKDKQHLTNSSKIMEDVNIILDLKYKRVSDDTRNAVRRALDSDEDYYSIAVDKIRELLPSKNTYILNSANSCILTVIESLPEPILIPDQGGWNGFRKSAQILGKKICEIPTEDGLINIEELNDYIEDNDIKSVYITSLAGYHALQPINEIYETCNIHRAILVLDISSSIGYPRINQYCDVQIASTGSPKIVNTGNGGFINDLTGKIELKPHLLKTFKADKLTCAAIANEIQKAPETIEKTIKANTYLKEKLDKTLKTPHYNIINLKTTGLNTIIKAPSKKKAKRLSYNIRKHLKVTPDKSIITTGPNYNRLKTASIIIETKNIDVEDLTKEKLDNLADIITCEINRTDDEE